MSTNIEALLTEAETLAWQALQDVPRSCEQRRLAAAVEASSSRAGARHVGAAAAQALRVGADMFPDTGLSPRGPGGTVSRHLRDPDTSNGNRARWLDRTPAAVPRLHQRIATLLRTALDASTLVPMSVPDIMRMRQRIAGIAVPVFSAAAQWSTVDPLIAPAGQLVVADRFARTAVLADTLARDLDRHPPTGRLAIPIDRSNSMTGAIRAWSLHAGKALALPDGAYSSRSLRVVTHDIAMLHRTGYQLVSALPHRPDRSRAVEALAGTLRSATHDAMNVARGWNRDLGEGADVPSDLAFARAHLQQTIHERFRLNDAWRTTLADDLDVERELVDFAHQSPAIARVAEQAYSTTRAIVNHQILSAPYGALHREQPALVPLARAVTMSRHAPIPASSDRVTGLLDDTLRLARSSQTVGRAMEGIRTRGMADKLPQHEQLQQPLAIPPHLEELDREAAEARAISDAGRRPTSGSPVATSASTTSAVATSATRRLHLNIGRTRS